jgi:hypothetical protein
MAVFAFSEMLKLVINANFFGGVCGLAYDSGIGC